MKVRNSKPFFQFFRRRDCRRVIGNVQATVRQFLIFFICLTGTDISDPISGSADHLHQLRTFFGPFVIADQIDHLPVLIPVIRGVSLAGCRLLHGITLFQKTVQLHPHLGVRRHLALTHNRIHVAVCEVHIRKLFPKLMVDILQITSDKMVNAACKQKNSPGLFRHSVQNICGSIDDKLFHVSVHQIVILHSNGGEPVHGIHLRRRQHHAAQAGLGTHKNLMALRNQHTDMYNLPGPPCRGGIFQA